MADLFEQRKMAWLRNLQQRRDAHDNYMWRSADREAQRCGDLARVLAASRDPRALLTLGRTLENLDSPAGVEVAEALFDYVVQDINYGLPPEKGEEIFVGNLLDVSIPAVRRWWAINRSALEVAAIRSRPSANTGPEQKIPESTLLAHVRLSDDIDVIVMDQPEDHNRDGSLLPAVISVQVNGQSWQTLGARGEHIGLPYPGPKPLADMAIQVWILRADGTVLAQKGKPGYVGFSNAGSTTDIMTVYFDHAAPKDLAGVVVRASGKLLVGEIKQ